MLRSLKIWVGTGLLAAAPVWAEKVKVAPAEPAEAEETESSETDSTDVPESTAETPKTPVVPGAKDSVPGKVHTVVRGDTLWDLSQSYLGTPWYWPKVWSYNPQIANPHWIYPGNQVRFFPGGDEGPTRVEAGEGPDEATAETLDEVAPSDTFTVDDRPNDTVEVVGKIGYTPQKGSVLVRRSGFITSKELDEAGTLTEATTDALMLSPPDNVYVTFKKGQTAKVGDRYVIFHTVKEIWNKRTGRRVGFMTQLVGTARILAVGQKRVKARVDKGWDSIKRGDLVGPYGEQYLDRVSPRANERELSGHIVTALDPSVSLFAEHHYVLVDLGSADGVQLGNTFTVVRQNDPSTLAGSVDPSNEVDQNLPLEEIATCMALDVREKATTCLMTRSLREVMEGDRAIMITGSTVADGASSR